MENHRKVKSRKHVTNRLIGPQYPPGIGLSTPRLDACAKVDGSEKYAADYYAPNMIWAGAKRAGVPHGRLREVKTDTAEKLPGVIAVLTHKHVKGSNRQGVVRKDQPVLVDDKVRHCGDAVALVLAEDQVALSKALELISLDIEPLPGVFDAEEAMSDGSPLVHDDSPDGNVLLSADITRGSGSDELERSDVVVEADFETPRQEHAYLETENGWAYLDETGRLVIVASTQTPFRDRTEVAQALGLEYDRVRIIAPYPGGAFGGKDGVTVQSLLGLAALHSRNRPVKIWWSREESLIAGAKRHWAQMRYRLGASGDGTLESLDVSLVLDTGPYDHLGGVVLALAIEHAGGPYRIPNVRFQGRAVYTNNPIGGAFRGFGVAQVTAAMEQMMDMLADRIAADPVSLRLKNAVRPGDTNSMGITLVRSTGLVECLNRLSSHELWQTREEWKAAAGPFKLRGAGIVAQMHATGYGPVVPDVANAKIELTAEGRIRVYCGVVDMGQGNASTNAQIAGAIMGQGLDRIDLTQPDTDLTLPSGSASASRCTYTFGNALIGAAEILKTRILERAADLLMAPGTEDIALVPGAIKDLRTGREVDLASLSQFMSDDERVATNRFRAPIAHDNVGAADDVRLHGLAHNLYSYAAGLALVEVDEITGQVEVKKYLAVTDCGAIINPQVYEQQIQGAAAQGIGYATMEEVSVRNGLTMNPNLSTYVIPTAMDIPEIVCEPVEIYESTGPFGLKGVGEIGTNGPAPAIANAVADACGIRLRQWPLTAERVLGALLGHDNGPESQTRTSDEEN